MVEYRNTLSPLYECAGFIEHYLNQNDDYQKMLQNCSSDQEREMIQALMSGCTVMGEAFVQNFSKDRFLFTYLHENQSISPALSLLYVCSDDQQRTLSEEFVNIREMIQKDPCILLREIVSNEKGFMVSENLKEDELLAMMDEFHLEDGVKWKIWQLHRHLEDTVKKLEQIMEVMLPIYHRYDTLYEQFLNVYQQEQRAEYPQGDMYRYAAELLNIKFKEEQVIVTPVISRLRSLSFLTKKRADSSNYLMVYWSIGSIQRLIKEKETIDTESMCSALKLLSDRSKFDILRYIANQHAYGAQIANELHLSTPTISYHMQSLLNARLVSFQKENNRLYYQLNKAYLKELFDQIYKTLTE